MSFSADVKTELCRTEPGDCCARAECYGVLLYCNTFCADRVRIVTEHQAFAARVRRLFARVFDVSLQGTEQSLGKSVLSVQGQSVLQRVYGSFGYDAKNSLSLHVNLGILEDECCRAAFLRGAFLAGGSMIDPEKRYHWELLTSHLAVSREVRALLQDMGYEPKSVMRAGNSVLYFKQSETIEDLLTLMGAPVSAMALMTTKLEKELRNDVNRQVNCDTANLEKAVAAAQQQIDAIQELRRRGTELPAKLEQTARLRLENPEATLQELASLSDPPITKSAVNHRLRKLQEMAEENAAV